MNKVIYKKRNTNTLFNEKVPAEILIKLLYSNTFLTPILKGIVANSFLSKCYGLLMNTRFSKNWILSFVQNYSINTNEYEKKIVEFNCFNDFFKRKIKPEYRPIDFNIHHIIAPSDGKILVYNNFSFYDKLYLKGSMFDLYNFLENSVLVNNFKDCSIAIIRLAPADYHRFHFPYEGKASKSKLINGLYYSVSPIALRAKPDVFFENKRTICEIKNDIFGSYLYIEIGATFVGSIKQTYKSDTYIKKGQEKGYFEFGGSTIVLMFRANTITFDSDLIDNSNQCIETEIKMGEKIATIKK